MLICKQCGVELDSDMNICPLCETSVSGDDHDKNRIQSVRAEAKVPEGKKYLLQRVLLQVLSVILFSGIAATLIIDLVIHQAVTWSVYSVITCLIAFSYVLLMSLWHTRLVFQLLGGLLISTLMLLLLNKWVMSDWPVRLAIPLLIASNTIAILLTIIIKNVRSKGLNVLALVFVGIAVLCLAIEGIISAYFENTIKVQWSVIVAACLFPVVAVIAFMHLRTRRNADLQKIFHT